MIALLLAVLLLGGMTSDASAADWGAIVPGETTLDAVRARWGEPSKRNPEKVDGYDTTNWIYEGERAPGGLRRLVISFGLLTPQGYRPEIVRTFRLQPKPGVFTQHSVVVGWGEPAGIGREGGEPAMIYDEGLIVVYESDGWQVKEMIFTPPQPKPAR